MARKRRVKAKWRLKTVQILQTTLNILVTILAVGLVVMMFKEAIGICLEVVGYNVSSGMKGIFTRMLNFFIGFQCLVLVIRFVNEEHDFPLRHIMYIGVTATVRFIIVEHTDSVHTLYVAISVLVLILLYCGITTLFYTHKIGNLLSRSK